MGKKIKEISTFILYFIWQFPQNIVALFMLLYFLLYGDLRKIRYENYCFVLASDAMSGGISLGNFIFLSDYSSKRETTILHELGHVKQSHMMGPIYLLIIGIPSICWAAFRNKKKYPCYYSFYTESWANKLAKLGVDSKCRLYILKRD